MRLKLYFQPVISDAQLPSEKQFKQWIKMALPQKTTYASITVRITDENESQTLNHTFRGKNKPTNVLSFPADPFEYEKKNHYVGDLVFCYPVIQKEATAQHKTLAAHFAHLTIHGVLHLLGYDHDNEKAARKMEALEIKLLQQLGIENPYEID
jgi:probable rRNA maturation factor